MITTFRHYAQSSVSVVFSRVVVKPETGCKISANNRRRRDIFKLSATDQDLLGSLGYKKKIDDVDRAILVNAQFVTQMVENPEIFGHALEGERMEPEAQGSEKQVEESLGGSCVVMSITTAYDYQRQFWPPHSSPL